MEQRYSPTAPVLPGSLTAARLHVQTLSEGDREALLRALLEQYEQAASLRSPAATPRSSVSSSGSRHSLQLSTARPSTRAYWCTSCGQKLARKSAWKRCCTSSPHADAVGRSGRRKRGAWGCGFCAAFLGSLDRYHEHVALHFEGGKTLAHWHHENVIYGLLHQPLVHDAWRELQTSRYGRLSHEHRPKLSWRAATTARAHGYLENESPGQLQDLLECFDPARHSADYVAQLADREAIHITLSVEDPPLELAAPRVSFASAASRSSLSPPRSKWATAAPSSSVFEADLGARAPADSTGRTSRPLPRVYSHAFRPTPDYHHHLTSTPPAQDQTMNFLHLGSHHSLSFDHASDRLGDWNSLTSTVVDDTLPLSLPQQS